MVLLFVQKFYQVENNSDHKMLHFITRYRSPCVFQVAKRAYHRKKARGGAVGGAPLIPCATGGLPPHMGAGGGPSTTSFSTSSVPVSQQQQQHPPSTTATVQHTSINSTVHASNASHHHHRPKKGMATAKQRLGKILKIHKMIY